ncbi:MAG: hypothetical protein ACQEQE_05775 [Bacillota bacterium]
MKKIINLKSTNRGIGLDFYSNKDIEKFNEVKNKLEEKNLNMDVTQVDWDVQNNELHYPDEKVENVLKDVNIRLKH